MAVGDTIVWVNRDLVPHTATDSGPPKWDTGHLMQGDSGRYVARKAGVSRYICIFHPTMRGTLIVR